MAKLVPVFRKQMGLGDLVSVLITNKVRIRSEILWQLHFNINLGLISGEMGKWKPAGYVTFVYNPMESVNLDLQTDLLSTEHIKGVVTELY